jgi:hypothetical protein
MFYSVLSFSNADPAAQASYRLGFLPLVRNGQPCMLQTRELVKWPV